MHKSKVRVIAKGLSFAEIELDNEMKVNRFLMDRIGVPKTHLKKRMRGLVRLKKYTSLLQQYINSHGFKTP